MTTINLREFYPWYTCDEFIEVSHEVAEELFADKRYQKSHRQRMKRNKSYYSLDAGDGIENNTVYFYIIRISFGADRHTFGCNKKALTNAIDRLPEIQERLKDVVIENRDFELDKNI